MFSQSLVFGAKYISFVEINILKTLQELEAATKEGFGKKMFLKCREILKDYKSDQNPLKMFKGTHFW